MRGDGFSVLFVTIIFHGFISNQATSSSSLTAIKRENDSRPLCQCGNSGSSLQTRVVGGHDAKLGQFPYATAIMSRRLLSIFGQRSNLIAPFCGGTVISDRHVLTAGHCVRDKTCESIALDIDEFDLNDKQQEEGRIYRRSSILKAHPEHQKEGYKNDIGIIEFDKPLDLGESARAAWIVGPGVELSEGTTVTVYGWGRLAFHGSPSRVLQTLDIPVVDSERCQQHFATKIEDKMMLCAGGEEGKDACLGDSGSGLVTRVGNEEVLVGVVSFGKECALPNTPGVYTKVSSYSDWIYNETLSAGCQPCFASAENFE